MTNWQQVKLCDALIINPIEKLSKGTIAKKVSMERLRPFCRDVLEYEFDKFSGGSKFRNKDTIMARITPCLENGKRAQINMLEQDEIGFGSTEFIIFREKENISNSNFIYYLICSDLIREPAIKSMVGSSGRQRVQIDVLKELIIPLPPLDIQKKIAGVLGALDDKIELNNRINNNLEQQAQSLFKSWFVDFEPFGGTMPDDWKVGKVDDIIELFDSQRIPLSGNQRENMQKLYPYYGATSIMDYVDNYIFDGKYLLLGEDGTVVDNEGFPILQYVWGKFWVNNHTHVLQGKNGFNVESLYLFFKKTNIKSIVTGAVQPKVNQANLRAIPAIIPNLECMDKFNNIIDPLFAMLRNNKEENTRLAALRDTLLPKLMSGEIDVSNVDISALTSTDKLSFTGV